MLLRSEFVGERGCEVVIKFDCGQAGGAFGERAGEDATAGSDFEHCVAGCEVRGGDDARYDAAVNEEVLS